MAVVQKGVPGLETASDALNVIVAKCTGHPKIGSHIGGGLHVSMPPSWDGQGGCPPGWTKQPTAVWVISATDTVLVIDDTLATALALPANQARLTSAEITTLNAALAARVSVDTANYVPKAAASAAA